MIAAKKQWFMVDGGGYIHAGPFSKEEKSVMEKPKGLRWAYGFSSPSGYLKKTQPQQGN